MDREAWCGFRPWGCKELNMTEGLTRTDNGGGWKTESKYTKEDNLSQKPKKNWFFIKLIISSKTDFWGKKMLPMLKWKKGVSSQFLKALKG